MDTATARDIAIVVLALESLLVTLLLLVTLGLLWRLTNMLQNDIKPILSSANRTARTVEGTTKFMTDNFVSPLIKVASLAVGAGKVVRTLGRIGRGRRRKPNE